MKLAIVGSRGFCDAEMLADAIATHFSTDNCHIFDEIVSGGANGADKLAAEYARIWDIPLREFLPDWDGLGKRAGFVRNEQIVAYADFVLAFWDGESKGTASTLSIAKRLKKPTMIIYFK